MTNSNTKHKYQRVEILVRGTVQGVGFRPFIYNLASRFAIAGTVTNTSDGVVIVANAEDTRLQLFLLAIEKEAPPLARITSIETHPLPFTAENKETKFEILPSTAGSSANTAIPPDIALCSDCLSELLNPRRPKAPLPFYQLHQLRPTLYNRRNHPLRQAANLDEGFPDVFCVH